MFINKMSKILVAIIILTLLATSVGCGGNTGTKETSTANTSDTQAKTTTEPVKEEPQTVSWMVMSEGNFFYDKPLKIFKKIEEDCNITLKMSGYNPDGFSDKFNVLVSSNDLPDVTFIVNNQTTIDEIGPKGALLPISDYLDKMPSLNAFFQKHEQELSQLKASDGKIYIAPCGLADNIVNTQGINIREDILKKNGYDINNIKTTDDLYKALTVLKDANGGKSVFSGRYGIGNLNNLARVFGVYSIQDFGLQYNNDTQQFEYPLFAQNLKDAITYFARLYKDGILSKDFLSMQDENWSAANKAGDLMFFADNSQNCWNFNDVLRKTFPEANYVNIVPPSYNGKVYPWKSDVHFITWGFGDVINAKTKSLEGALRLEEWIFNEANREFKGWGIEGESFKKESDGSYVSLLDDKQMKEVWGTDGQNVAFNRLLGFWSEYVFLNGGSVPSKGDSTILKEKNLWFDMNKIFYTLPPDPPVRFSTEDTDKLKELKTPLDTFIKENITNFIIGVKPMGEWDAFVTKAKDMKMDEVLKIYNDTLAKNK